MILTDILQTGAQFFVILVSVVVAFVAGITTTDYLKTKEREKKYLDSEDKN